MGTKCCVCLKKKEGKPEKSKDSSNINLEFRKSNNVDEKSPILDLHNIKGEIKGDLQPKKLYNAQSSIQCLQFKQDLKTAITNENISEINNILSSGFPLNEPITNDKFTSLHLASKNGSLSVVKLLLGKPGINIDIQDENEKWTSLMLACMNGHIDIVKYLLNNKANKSLLSDENKTALAYSKTIEGLEKLLMD